MFVVLFNNSSLSSKEVYVLKDTVKVQGEKEIKEKIL